MPIDGFFCGIDPFVEIHLEPGPRPVRVLVDTGFSGHLMLENDLVAEFGLPEIGDDFYVTAPRDEVWTTVHIGSLQWFDRTIRVPVIATKGRTALLGMKLLFDRSLRMAPSEGVLRIG